MSAPAPNLQPANAPSTAPDPSGALSLVDTTLLTPLAVKLRQRLSVGDVLAAVHETVCEALRPQSLGLWAEPALTAQFPSTFDVPPFDIEEPLARRMLEAGLVERVTTVPVASAALESMRAAGAHLVAPLVRLGSFMGAIVLGPPNDRELYSAQDIRWLAALIELAAPAVQGAVLVDQHEAAKRAQETSREELQIAQRIQRSLLPETLPEIEGWRVAAHYQPARVIGGDLYDFIALPGDLLGIVLGDASDKSVPAAMVMASARTLLRAAALRLVLPGQVLARANEDLCAQIPPGMFVTCFFALLDVSTGRMRYANAGQSPPILRAGDSVRELKASGWPLGMMPGVSYDEGEVTLEPGSTVLLFSDGLLETHAPDGEMFGTSRIEQALKAVRDPTVPIESVLAVHGRFAGPSWEQEDDVTLVSLARLDPARQVGGDEQTLAELTVPSEPDIERSAAAQILAAVGGLPLTDKQRDRLSTAIAETVMNAAEHGNLYDAATPVRITVLQRGPELVVRVTDTGRSGTIPDAPEPDLDAKLAGLQSPRGWGLFLIEKMVDRFEIISTPEGHTVELGILLEPTSAEVT